MTRDQGAGDPRDLEHPAIGAACPRIPEFCPSSAAPPRSRKKSSPAVSVCRSELVFYKILASSL
jgi:hypothetical protein